MSIINPFGKERKGDNKLFVCVWCGYEFRTYLRTSTGDSKRSNQSNSVRCPHCKGFMSGKLGK